MADSKYQAATSAQREELKESLQKAVGIIVPSNYGGVGPTSYRAGFDPDGACTALGAALADMSYAGQVIDSDQTVVSDGTSLNIKVGSKSTSAKVAVDDSTLGDATVSSTTIALVANSDTVPVQNSAGTSIGSATATVAGNAITGAKLAATVAAVKDGDTIEVGDADVSVAVASGAATYSLKNGTDAVVSNSDTLSVSTSASTAVTSDATVTVASNAVSKLILPATATLVKNSGTVPVKTAASGSTAVNGTAAVASGAVTAVTLPATSAIVNNSGTIAVQNSAGTAIGNATATVASGAISAVKLPATIAGIANEAVLTLDSKTYTFTVAGGVVTAIAVADA